MCAYAAALLLVLFGFRVIRRSMPELRGIANLQRYLLYGLGAILLFGLRARAPAFVTVVIANLLLFAATAFLYRAAVEILEVRRHHFSWVMAVCIAAAPPLVWFTAAHDDVTARLLIHCTVMVAIYGLTAALLFRERRAALRYPARASAALMIVSILMNVAWGVFGVIRHPNPNFLHPDAVDTGFSYLAMILAMANLVALAWLAVSAHRRELQVIAETDGLTGLLNRGAFEEILRRELLRGTELGHGMGLMMVDIDFFKQVNDAHGHLVGDDVLRRVGESLRAGIRPADVLARFGGEEFVILLREASLSATEEVAERLRRDLELLDDLPRGLNLTGSFGVAASLPGETVEEFVLRADEALYRSKRDGRNLVRADHSGPRLSAVRSGPSRH